MQQEEELAQVITQSLESYIISSTSYLVTNALPTSLFYALHNLYALFHTRQELRRDEMVASDGLCCCSLISCC